MFFANGSSPTAAMLAYQKEFKVLKCPLKEFSIRQIISKFNKGQFKVIRQVGSGRLPCTENFKQGIFKMVRRCSKNSRYHISSVRDAAAKLP